MKAKLWLLAICLTLCTLMLVACGTARASGQQVSVTPGNAPRVEALSASASGFSVSRAFSSDMVIQRDEPIRVWGWADASRNGETVTATFAGKSAEGKIENGEWLVTFEEGFAASRAMGNAMTVTCGSDKVVFENVLVGDVYMVIGQSNVAYQVEAHCSNNGIPLSSLIDDGAPIRLKYNTLNDTAGYPARGTEEVCADVINGRPWWLPTVQNVRSFTALGYLFAREIVEKTGGSIPIGIIEIDGNGQPIGAFMPNKAAAETGSDSLSGGIFVPPGVNGTHARYMYNHYMYPYERYALAGVVWYQGESDFQQSTADTFVGKFTALMTHMRGTHNLKNKDFPVYVVELPTIYNRPADFVGDFHTMDLGYIRAEMGSIPSRLSNTYMAVSSDIFTDERYYNNLHPDIKDKQAARVADLAASVWYGLTPLEEATGPILKSYEISEDRKTAVLTFTNVGEGLSTSDGGKTVIGMAPILKNDAVGNASALTATITGKDQITVTSTRDMYGIAYNFVMDNFYGEEINLCNSHGKIASAFTFSETRMYQIRHDIIGEGAQSTEVTSGQTLAVHFRTTENLAAVGTRLMNVSGKKGSVTLSLYAFDTDYATSLSADPIEEKTFEGFCDYAYAEITFKRNKTVKAGEYLLVISDADGILLQTAAAHKSQVCYRDGAYAADVSLLLAVTYKDQTDLLYAYPLDPNTAPLETEPPTVAPTDGPTEPPVTAAPTAPVTDVPATEAPTDEKDDTGCASTLGAAGVLMLLTAAVCLRRRKDD